MTIFTLSPSSSMESSVAEKVKVFSMFPAVEHQAGRYPRVVSCVCIALTP